MNPARDPDAPVICAMCGDTGVVIVPHPRCVRGGRLECWPGSKGIRTVAVACTNRVPDALAHSRPCPAGSAAAFAGLMSWDSYTTRVGGLDGVAMLADMEAERAALARDGRPEGWGLAEMYPELASRVGLGVGVGV